MPQEQTIPARKHKRPIAQGSIVVELRKMTSERKIKGKSDGVYHSNEVNKMQEKTEVMRTMREKGQLRAVSDTTVDKWLKANVEGRHLYDSMHNGTLYKTLTTLITKASDGPDEETTDIYMKALGAMNAQGLRNLKTQFNSHETMAKFLKKQKLPFVLKPVPNQPIPQRDVLLQEIMKILDVCSVTRATAVRAVNVITQLC
jgi:hypothetical protein